MIWHILAQTSPPATVKTTGINWQSIGTILAALVAAVAFLTAIIQRRQKAVSQQISDAVDNLARVLEAKLETKDSVNNLRIEVARMKEQVTAMRQNHAEQHRGDQ